MTASRMACLLLLAFTLTGCGQKYPEAYGLYVRAGKTWTPVDSTKPSEVSEKPEILIFDSRLARSSDKPDDTITIRPMKWIRWNINALVANRDAGPRVYEKSRVGSFLPAEDALKMAYSPVKDRPDMLVASPVASLVDGYYVLDSLGDKVIFRRNASLNPDELPEAHVVDKWTVSHDESAGFSWDAFLAQSANFGRAVFNEGFEPPQKLASLLESLRQELETLVTAKSSPPILSFCKKVERLDPDLFASARKQCFSVIEAEIAQAKSNNDLPVAIGIGVMATNAGFSSDLILKEIETFTCELNAIEAAAAKATGELMADRTHAGERGALYQLDNGYSLAETSVAAESSHIFYSTRLMAYPEEQNRIWMGNIASFSKAEDLSVDIDADYPLNRRDKFTSAADQNRFFAEASKAFENWKTKWRSRLTVDVTARPYYWSERVFVYDLPYSMECVEGSDGIMAANVDLGADDETASRSTPHRRFDGNEKSYNMGQSWGEPGFSGSFRVKSTGRSPVKLRIRFCPAVGTEVPGYEKDIRQNHEPATSANANTALSGEGAKAVLSNEADKESDSRSHDLLVGTWSNEVALLTYYADGTGVQVMPSGEKIAISKWTISGDRLSLKFPAGSFGYQILKIDEAEYTIREDNGKEWHATRITKEGIKHEPAKDVVVWVDQAGITSAEVQSEADRLFSRGPQDIPPDQIPAIKEKLQQQAEENLVVRQLVKAEMQGSGVAITQEEVEMGKQNMEKNLPEGTTLAMLIANANVSMEELESNLRLDLFKTKVLKTELDAAQADVTDEAVRIYYNGHLEEFTQPEGRLVSHILVRVPAEADETTKTELRTKAEGIRKELLGGADFAKLASEASDCPSRTRGGVLGVIPKGREAKSFEDAVYGQRVGEIGEVVESPVGYHVIKVTGEQEKKVVPLDEVRDRLKAILVSQAQQKAYTDYIEGLKDKATIRRVE